MKKLLAEVEALLRDAKSPAPARQIIGRTLGFTCLGGLLYGAVMGSFGGIAGDRAWQIAFAAIKVPLLLLATFAIALPSFFVLNTLLGVRADFAEVLRALTASQAGLTIVLAALAPYTLLWYASVPIYELSTLFNGLMFALATVAAHSLLRQAYRPLLARHPSHHLLLRVWHFLYAFLAIQMAWVLRPFVGSPELPVQFFRDDSWGNAYVQISRTIWNALWQ